MDKVLIDIREEEDLIKLFPKKDFIKIDELLEKIEELKHEIDHLRDKINDLENPVEYDNSDEVRDVIWVNSLNEKE